MKIAISGSTGTGKSTLAAALAEKLSIPLIEENYQPLYDARVKGDFPPRLLTILRNKHTLEKAHSDFVTDRCPIDLMHLWLNQSGHKISRPLTNQFFELALPQLQIYDFVIIPPWNSIQLQQSTEALPRDLDIIEQLRHHASILGHAYMWAPKIKIIEIPQPITSLEARVDFVLEQIKKRRPELLQTAL